MKLKIRENLLYLALKIINNFDKRQRDLKYFNPEEVKSILIVSSTAIGDTLMSTPAIKAIRERYPHAKIIAHFNAKNMELFENNPYIDGIIPYYGGWKKFFKTIKEFRNHKFDVAVILHGNEPQATPMAYLGGARFIVKVPNSNKFRFLLSNHERIYAWKDFNHGIEARLYSAKLIDCNISDKKMIILEYPEGEFIISKFLKQNKIHEENILVGFQVGASTTSRMWSKDNFIELGRKLLEKIPNLSIIITGSPKEYNYCQAIADGIGKKALVSAGKIPLKYLPSLLKKLTLLVTGDTGIMHLAITVRTPIVGLFAVSDPKNSGPYYDKEMHIVIKKNRICKPCKGKKCKNPDCLNNIDIDEVYEAVLKIIYNINQKFTI